STSRAAGSALAVRPRCELMAHDTEVTSSRAEAGTARISIVAGQLPRHAWVLSAVLAVAVGVLGGLLLGGGTTLMAILACLVFIVFHVSWSAAVEGTRKCTDRLVQALVWSTFVLAMLPLVSLVVTVVIKGAPVVT